LTHQLATTHRRVEELEAKIPNYDEIRESLGREREEKERLLKLSGAQQVIMFRMKLQKNLS